MTLYPRYNPKHLSGFTLVEVLVAAVLLVIFTMTGLAIGNITIATLNQSRQRAEALQGIQLDLERIRQAALDFCRQESSTSYGPVDITTNTACPEPFNSYVSNFAQACDRQASSSAQMGHLFRNYLTSSLAASPISYQAPSGHSYQINRTVTIGSSPNGGSINVVSSGRTVTITYSAVPQGSNLSLQLTSLTVTPNAVAWCPIQYV